METTTINTINLQYAKKAGKEQSVSEGCHLWAADALILWPERVQVLAATKWYSAHVCGSLTKALLGTRVSAWQPD